jgi:Domain of unknown function (DUF4351)
MTEQSSIYEQWRQSAVKEGEQTGKFDLVLRQLNRRIGELTDSLKEVVQALPLSDVEELGQALLDFATVEDLEAWLEAHGVQDK